MTAEGPPPGGMVRALWRLLTGTRRPLPREPEARRLLFAREWNGAVDRIERLEGTPPPRDLATARFDALCDALEGDVARLRAHPPKAAIRRASPRRRRKDLRRAERQIADAEAQLAAMAERAQTAGGWAEEWERCAMLAVEAGDDALAREALAHRAEAAGVSRVLRREVETGRAVLAELRAALDRIVAGESDAGKR